MSTRQNGPPRTAPLPSSMAGNIGCAQNTPRANTQERGAKWQTMVCKQWFAISGRRSLYTWISTIMATTEELMIYQRWFEEL